MCIFTTIKKSLKRYKIFATKLKDLTLSTHIGYFNQHLKNTFPFQVHMKQLLKLISLWIEKQDNKLQRSEITSGKLSDFKHNYNQAKRHVPRKEKKKDKYSDHPKAKGRGMS